MKVRLVALLVAVVAVFGGASPAAAAIPSDCIPVLYPWCG